MSEVTVEQLESIAEWAKDKVHNGNLPPWAWYQYMKLDETLTAIIRGMHATEIRDDLEKPAPLRLVDDSFEPNGNQIKPALDDLPLPM